MAKSVALHLAADDGKLLIVDKAVNGSEKLLNVRRLNQLGSWDNSTGKFTPNTQQDISAAGAAIRFVIRTDGTTLASDAFTGVTVSFAQADTLDATTGADTVVAPAFESDFESAGTPSIP
mgnify:CR=1 FL=1